MIERFSEVKTCPLEWLWPQWIPLGTISLLSGDPGWGKSTATMDLAARVSQGWPMPDGKPGLPPAGVVVLSLEDDLERVIVPRLRAAGADLRQIAHVKLRHPDGTQEEPVLSPEGIAAIEAAMTEVHARLVIVDPLVAFLPPTVNTHRDSDVRHALAPLQQMAERFGAAVLAVRHLNKTASPNPLYRGGGSIAFTAAGRQELLLSPNPDDPDGQMRVLAVSKANYARKPTSQLFELEVDPAVEQPRIKWLGPSRHTAKTLLAESAPQHSQMPIEEAEAFLREYLAEGPVAAIEIREAALDAGISSSTLGRAKKSLGIVSRKHGHPGQSQGWFWCWPSKGADGHQPVDSEHLRPSPERKPNSERENDEGDQRRPADDLRASEPLSDSCATAASDSESAAPARETCPYCDGPILHWSFGAVCTRCRQSVGGLATRAPSEDADHGAPGAAHD